MQKFISQLGAVLALGIGAFAGDITDIKHLVLFMQENRAFDHYYGTMAGVRGFSDPNVQYNPSTGLTTFQQKVNDGLSTLATTLLPFWISYPGGNYTAAAQCASGGSNSWFNNHLALNYDLNDQWAWDNTALSWTHFRRSDIPFHYALQDAWTVADMYQEGQIASTSPNRVTWMSGSINVPGGPQTPAQGGMVTDNTEGPGCEDGIVGFNCEPLYWKTVPEYHQDAGVTWRVWQDVDNYGDDLLIDSFAQYQNAPADSPLTIYGTSYPGLQAFYDACANGTLPLVSWIVGPAELSEHATYQPMDGAWLQQQIVNAVVKSPKYHETALMISYDESGGWGDHVTPFHSPNGTQGEWVQDPYNVSGYTYAGPGYRVPFTIVSPWTRGGRVFTEHADHNSQIMFMEEWLTALGYEGVKTTQMPAWRRAHMSNLVNAFDFDNPDLSIPELPIAPTPLTDDDGDYIGASVCNALYGNSNPPVPYGPENEAVVPSTLSEEGFKNVRGYLTEGRYLTFEMNGYAITNPSTKATDITGTRATADHSDIAQRWVLHALDGTAVHGGQGAGVFMISSALDGRYLHDRTSLETGTSGAENYTIADLGNGDGYTLVTENGKYLTINPTGNIDITGDRQKAFQIYSVTYQS